MNITLLNTTLTTVPTAKGSYQQLEVAYKNNTFQGKVEGKKLMSFGASKPAFDVLSVASPNTTYEVTTNKNDKGYIDWIAITSANVGEPAAPQQALNKPSNTKEVASNVKGSWETAEERAQRQVLIVRQSSVSAAVAALSAGAKSTPKVDDVIDYAKKIEDFVFGKKSPGATTGGATGFDDVPDFDPKVFDEQPQVD